MGRSEVMSLPRGSHANTFGGNPLALAAFNAVMDVIEEERLWERSERLGAKALRLLGEAAEELGIVGHVRGKGLMIGVELVKDENTREPHREALAWVLERSFKRGLLVIGAGVSAVRIAPPLTIEEELFDRGLEILVEVLREADRRFSQG